MGDLGGRIGALVAESALAGVDEHLQTLPHYEELERQVEELGRQLEPARERMRGLSVEIRREIDAWRARHAELLRELEREGIATEGEDDDRDDEVEPAAEPEPRPRCETRAKVGAPSGPGPRPRPRARRSGGRVVRIRPRPEQRRLDAELASEPIEIGHHVAVERDAVAAPLQLGLVLHQAGVEHAIVPGRRRASCAALAGTRPCRP